MMHILLSQTGSYRDVVDHLRLRGAQVISVGPANAAAGIHSKKSILKSMFSPALLRARGAWTASDRVLVIGWQSLPILAMIRLGIVPRPKKLLVMACFIHGQQARRIVNRAWRWLRFPGMGFIAFSQGEARNLVDNVGMDVAAVHFHLWRQELDGQADATTIGDDGFIFSGGFSNRDYDLLLRATRDIDVPLCIVASAHNQIDAADHPHAIVHRDIAEQKFEALLARSRVVAMPLKSQGEACGQSVLLRVLRNGKPLIATRHEAIEAYLGRDYGGFVPHSDAGAMRSALLRAVQDADFRNTLGNQIRQAKQHLERSSSPGEEIERFLLSD